jgi:hypothetical protein
LFTAARATECLDQGLPVQHRGGIIEVDEEVAMELIGHVCSRCHGEAMFGFGSTWLCENCYGVIGSCCMEFDGDDMFLEDRSWWDSRMAPKP